MNIFARRADGTTHELHGFFNPIEFLGEKIVDFLHVEKKSNMYKVLFAVAKCEISAPDGFEYFARVNGSSIDIYCASEEDKFNAVKQQEAIFITRFNGNISSRRVKGFINRDALRAWFKLGELSLKGINSLTGSLLV